MSGVITGTRKELLFLASTFVAKQEPAKRFTNVMEQNNYYDPLHEIEKADKRMSFKQQDGAVFDDRKTIVGGLEYMDNFELAPPGTEAEDVLKWKQTVQVKFRQADEPFTGTIVGVHHYGGKVRYDVALWLGENEETRIRGIDSMYVRAWQPY